MFLHSVVQEGVYRIYMEFRENKMKMHKCVFPADFTVYTG